MAAIAIPKFNEATANAKDDAKEATKRTVNSAYQIYLASGNNTGWPEDYVNGATLVDGKVNVPFQDETLEYSLNGNVWE